MNNEEIKRDNDELDRLNELGRIKKIEEIKEIQIKAYRNSKDNPCVARCTTLYTDICLGCGRTSDEVSNWVTFSEEKKSEIWKRLYLEKIKNLNSRKIK